MPILPRRSVYKIRNIIKSLFKKSLNALFIFAQSVERSKTGLYKIPYRRYQGVRVLVSTIQRTLSRYVFYSSEDEFFGRIENF